MKQAFAVPVYLEWQRRIPPPSDRQGAPPPHRLSEAP